MVQVPSLEVEDQRQLHRELVTLKVEHTSHINRIKGLLIGQGLTISVAADLLERLDTVRLWDGSGLPAGLRTRLEREYERLQLVNQQIQQIEKQQEEQLRTSDHPSIVQVRQLLRLKGIGVNSAWLFVKDSAHSSSVRGFRARKLIPSVPKLAALDDCGAPLKTSACQVISKSTKPAATTVSISSASSRVPAIQPVHRSILLLALSGTAF